MGKLLGWLAVIGIGAFAYNQYKKAKAEQNKIKVK